MLPKWLLEDEVFEEDLVPIHQELERQGIEYKIVRYVPFEGVKVPSNFADNDCVICYGSLNFVSQLQTMKKWVPGWWCTLPNFLCTTYFTYFGKHLFNSQYVFVTVAEFPRLKDWLFSTFGIDDCLFIRPNTGFKTFAGKIIEKRFFDKDWEWILEFSAQDDLILVSSPKHIDVEWRLVVSDKKVIAGCQYKTYEPSTRKLGFDPDPFCPPEPISFANRIAVEVGWEPDPMYVMDICLSNGEYYLLELNAFSTSGWYDCDPAAIIKEANRQAVKVFR